MDIDVTWSMRDIEKVAREFHKHTFIKTTVHFTKKDVQEAVKILQTIVEKHRLEITNADKCMIYFHFRECVIKEMRKFIRMGSWRLSWGAPDWILQLDQFMPFINTALRLELDKSSPYGNKIRYAMLDELLSELLRSARAAAEAATDEAAASAALNSPEAVRRLAQSTSLSQEKLYLTWSCLYQQSLERLEHLWLAGDRSIDMLRLQRFSAAHWRLAELALLYDTKATFVSKDCFKMKQKLISLALLFRLISNAYDKRKVKSVKEQGSATSNAVQVSHQIQKESGTAYLKNEMKEEQNSRAFEMVPAENDEPTTFPPNTILKSILINNNKKVSDIIETHPRGSYTTTIDNRQCVQQPDVEEVRPPIKISSGGSYKLTIDSTLGQNIASSNTAAANIDTIKNPFSEYEFTLKVEECQLINLGCSSNRLRVKETLEEEDMWSEIAAEYGRSGRMSSPLSLQRRWVELQRATRAVLLSRRDSSWRGAVHRLMLAVAQRFPEVISGPVPSWYELVRRGAVYELPTTVKPNVQKAHTLLEEMVTNVNYINDVLSAYDVPEEKSNSDTIQSITIYSDANNPEDNVLDGTGGGMGRTNNATNRSGENESYESFVVSHKADVHRTSATKDNSNLSKSGIWNCVKLNAGMYKETSSCVGSLLVERPTASPREVHRLGVDVKLISSPEVIVTPVEKIPLWKKHSRNGVVRCRAFSVRTFVQPPAVDRKRDTLRKYIQRSGPSDEDRKMRFKRLQHKLGLGSDLSQYFCNSDKNLDLLELCKPAVVKLRKTEPGSSPLRKITEADVIGTSAERLEPSVSPLPTAARPETSRSRKNSITVSPPLPISCLPSDMEVCGDDDDCLIIDEPDDNLPNVEDTDWSRVLPLDELKKLIKLLCNETKNSEKYISQQQENYKDNTKRAKLPVELMREKKNLVVDMVNIVKLVPQGLKRKREQIEVQNNGSRLQRKECDPKQGENKRPANAGKLDSKMPTGPSAKKPRLTKKTVSENDSTDTPALDGFEEWERQKTMSLKYFNLPLTTHPAKKTNHTAAADQNITKEAAQPAGNSMSSSTPAPEEIGAKQNPEVYETFYISDDDDVERPTNTQKQLPTTDAAVPQQIAETNNRSGISALPPERGNIRPSGLSLKDILNRPNILNYDSIVRQGKIPTIVKQYQKSNLEGNKSQRKFFILNVDQVVNSTVALVPVNVVQVAAADPCVVGEGVVRKPEDTSAPPTPVEAIQMPIIARVSSLASCVAASDANVAQSLTFYYLEEFHIESEEWQSDEAPSGLVPPFSMKIFKSPISRDTYTEHNTNANVPIIRMDSLKRPYIVLGQYLFLTTEDIPIANSTYWTTISTGAYKFCTQILFPRDENCDSARLLICRCEKQGGRCDLCGLFPTQVNDLEQNAPKPATGKIKVKSFAKLMADVANTKTPTKPLSIFYKGRMYRKKLDMPLTYESEDIKPTNRTEDCRVANDELYRRMTDHYVKVLTAVSDEQEALAMLREGRKVLFASQEPLPLPPGALHNRTTVTPQAFPAPAPLIRELRRLLHKSTVKGDTAGSDVTDELLPKASSNDHETTIPRTVKSEKEFGKFPDVSYNEQSAGRRISNAPWNKNTRLEHVEHAEQPLSTVQAVPVPSRNSPTTSGVVSCATTKTASDSNS